MISIRLKNGLFATSQDGITWTMLRPKLHPA